MVDEEAQTLRVFDCIKILDVYTLEEIFELNELTEADVLLYLVEERLIQLPKVLPVDV